MLCLFLVLAELTLRPTDTESLTGAPTFLNCSSDNVAEEIFWFRYEVGSTVRKLVYGFKKLYPPNEERFQLEKIEGAGTVAFNLVIPVTIDKDAGTYECQDGAGQGQLSPQVQLIVLGKGHIDQRLNCFYLKLAYVATDRRSDLNRNGKRTYLF